MIKYFFYSVTILLVLAGQSFSQYTLQIISSGAGTGHITVDGNPQTLTYIDQFAENSTVNLSAIANEGSHFTEWSGDLASTNSSESIFMDSDKIIYANFDLNQHTITLSSNPVSGGSYSGDGVYNFGDEAVIIATPNLGFNFENWTENNIEISNNATYNFTVDSDRNLVANFSVITFNINGNTDVGDVTLTWFDEVEKTITSASNGSYSITVPYNWSGSITPSKTGYTFSPALRTYTTVTKNRNFQNFDVILNSYTITGNTGVGEVTLSWFDGTNKTTTSGTDGSYTITIPYGWSGTVTPSKTGYTFVPTSRSYIIVTANQVNQNYTGTLNSYTITGNTGVGEVTLSWFDGTNKTTTSGTDGSYTITIPYGWSGTVTPSKTGYTFVPANRSYTNVTTNQVNQNFNDVIDQFEIKFTLGGTGSGKIKVNGIVYNLPHTEIVNDNSQITIQAVQDIGSNFTSWTGDLTGNTNPTSLLITSAKNITVNFTLKIYSIDLFKAPSQGGNVTGQGNYNYKSDATVIATPNKGWNFTNWTENNIPVSLDSLYKFIVDTNRTLTANFARRTHEITTFVNPAFSGSIITGGGDYPEGNTANLIAVPSTGWRFLNWTENGNIVSSDSIYSFSVENDRTITGNFTKKIYSVALSVLPVESGTLNGAGAYQHGATVTISTSANEGWLFKRWTENDQVISENSSFVFVIDKPRNFIANYEKKKYDINLSSSPDVGGSTLGNSTYSHGDTVTVIANAKSQDGYDFVNWTENGTEVSNNTTYTFIADKNRTLIANFKLRTYKIDLSINPINSGTVTGENSYTHGQNVTVQATPTSGWLFVNWTENNINVTSNSSYSFVANKNRNLIANFSKDVYSISAVPSPIEGGSISGTGSFYYGQIATLIAAANPGWTFVNWTKNGTVVSSDSNYIFTVNSSSSLVANFKLTDFTINCSSQPSEAGFTTGCGIARYNQIMKIKAEPNNGYKFINWTENGEVVSENIEYEFVVKKSRNIIAQFDLINSIEMDESAIVPDEYYLSNAYPNPFNPETNLKFGLPEQSTVNLLVIDVTGRIIQTVIDNIFLPAGNYINHINGSNLASGIYFYVINAQSNISDKNFRKSGKFILLK